MTAHSKTPYITVVWIFFPWERGSTGAQGAQAGIFLDRARAIIVWGDAFFGGDA